VEFDSRRRAARFGHPIRTCPHTAHPNRLIYRPPGPRWPLPSARPEMNLFGGSDG